MSGLRGQRSAARNRAHHYRLIYAYRDRHVGLQPKQLGTVGGGHEPLLYCDKGGVEIVGLDPFLDRLQQINGVSG